MKDPSTQLLTWALTSLLPGTAPPNSSGAPGEIVGVRGLREGGAPWRVDVRAGGDIRSAVIRALDAADPADRGRHAAELAALTLAGRHGVPAPRIIATDPTGEHSGAAAMLLSVVPGTSRIPTTRIPQRMHALGAAAAALHRIPLSPTPDLPHRTRSIAGVDFEAMRRDAEASAVPGSPQAATLALLAEAERLLAEDGLPAGCGGAGDDLVLVHGDLWQGNVMWEGDTITGIIDWDCAGAGHPGIDLGSLRCDAAIFFGVDAADEILAGWRTAMTTAIPATATAVAGTAVAGIPAAGIPVAGGRGAGVPGVAEISAVGVAYWDLVAALSTPPDMGMWLPVLHDQGRTDLDHDTINARRDELLASAIKVVTSSWSR